MAAPGWLEMGRIGPPFGVKGWLHVESYTEPKDRLLDYEDWNLRQGKSEPLAKRLAEGREHGKGLIVRLEGIEDRDAAALLQGAMIAVARSELPPLKKGEFYQADLIGLAVTNLEGAALGVVRHFVATPGGEVMVVHREAGHELWIPAVRRHLNKVDLAAGQILVDWPAELE